MKDTDQAVELNGGYGACVWTDSGRQRVRISWKHGGEVVVDTVVVIPKRGVLSLNICTVIPKKPPPGVVRAGWALRLKGQKCSG